MIANNLHQYTTNKQERRRQDDWEMLKGIAFENLLHNIIREYGKYDGQDYSVELSDIDNPDKKLLISYFCDSDEYADACKSTACLDALIEDHRKQIDFHISQHTAEVYREDMEEMGMVSRRHYDNNEQYWTRG